MSTPGSRGPERSTSTSAAKTLLDSVTSITAKGPHTIVIELSQGFADLPWVMTDYHLAMVPAKPDGSADWESGIGAGARVAKPAGGVAGGRTGNAVGSADARV